MDKNKYNVDVYKLPVLAYSDLYDIKSGVYFLFSTECGELFYIGKSKNLRKRIDQHISRFGDLRFYTKGSSRYNLGYKAISVPESDLLSTESFFIEKYRPPMNNYGSKCRSSYESWIYQRMVEYDAWQKSICCS